jgi:hypothetical protein
MVKEWLRAVLAPVIAQAEAQTDRAAAADGRISAISASLPCAADDLEVAVAGLKTRTAALGDELQAWRLATMAADPDAHKRKDARLWANRGAETAQRIANEQRDRRAAEDAAVNLRREIERLQIENAKLRALRTGAFATGKLVGRLAGLLDILNWTTPSPARR